MVSVKRVALLVILVGMTVVLPASSAQAQAWFGRNLRGRPMNGWWPYPGGGQLAGGEIVGTVPFAGNRVPPTTTTAAQWNQMINAQARQTPVMTAAQWDQFVRSQAPQPSLSPAQQRRLDVLRPAPLLPPNNLLTGDALLPWQRQAAPPQPPAKDK